MKNKLQVMLLGSLPKGDNEREYWHDWKTVYIEKISHAFPQAILLNGDLISDNKGPELVVGHDLWLLKHTDIAIVNAIEKIGAGTAQEMMMAKYFHKPLISVIPQNTHHRKSNIMFHGVTIPDWIHPFLNVSSDVVVETIEEAIIWIEKYNRNPKKIKIKDFSIFESAIEAFEKKMPYVYQAYKER